MINCDSLTQPLEHLSLEIANKVRPASNEQIAVSVIIPCFNSASFIRPCLESLRLQTLPAGRFEVICVDDCSTDKTGEVLAEYAGKIRNLRVIRHEVNRKQGAARNTGLDNARGTHVFFLDSDDFLRVDALEVLLNLIGDADVAVCQHITTRFDKPHKRAVSNRHVKTTLSLSALENTVGWWPFGMLISRRLLWENNIRFREGVYFEDIDFNIRIFLTAKSHQISKEALYYYIERDGSTVNSINEKKLSDSVAAISEVSQLQTGYPVEEQAAFYKKASSWVHLQATRLRDCGISREERDRLAKAFVRSLEIAGLLDRLEPGLAERVLVTAKGEPVRQSNAAITGSSSFRYNPWPKDFREEFAGKVIIFCEVNYHIRSAAPVARHLKARGIDSIIVDASRSTSFTTNRPLPDDELPLYADIDIRSFNVAEVLPFATEAAAFVFMNDTTYTKRLIFENFGFGVPTFGFYEGINDDWNLDRKSPRMPYRSVDYILLPGLYQKGFYDDRECRVVGLPNVRGRLALPYVPPVKRRAVINVNFTYGVLEDRRDEYVQTAVQACRELGLDYVITQHPADKADLSAYNVGRESVYDMLDAGTVLISRFSTTMLESLAIGRPVVYHNPIGEKVPKFSVPLGAFSQSHDVDSLKAALQSELAFVDKGGDVRARAALFLHFHCHTLAERDPDQLAADAITEVLANPPQRFAFKLGASNFERQAGHPEAIRTLGKLTSETANRRTDLGGELSQLRANFADLSEYASKLEHRGIRPSGPLKRQGDLIDTLKHERDTEAMSLLLTTLGSGFLTKPDETNQRIKNDPSLAAAIDTALLSLSENRVLTAHFLRIRETYGR